MAPWRAPTLPPRSATTDVSGGPAPDGIDKDAAPAASFPSRDLLGRRVTVRYRLHGDPAHPYSEAVGVVMLVTSATLSIVRRNGETVEIPIPDIVAGHPL